MKKKTLVLGASENPDRYSYKAVKKLVQYGHPVVAVGRRKGSIDAVNIHAEPVQVQDIDTVTLYLNPQNQKPYYDYILSLKPKRILFNPGTENRELEALAEANHIATLQGCTLVLLSIGNY